MKVLWNLWWIIEMTVIGKILQFSWQKISLLPNAKILKFYKIVIEDTSNVSLGNKIIILFILYLVPIKYKLYIRVEIPLLFHLIQDCASIYIVFERNYKQQKTPALHFKYCHWNNLHPIGNYLFLSFKILNSWSSCFSFSILIL